MKVSELITTLQNYITVHGDDEITVVAPDQDFDLEFEKIHEGYYRSGKGDVRMCELILDFEQPEKIKP